MYIHLHQEDQLFLVQLLQEKVLVVGEQEDSDLHVYRKDVVKKQYLQEYY